MSNVHYFAADVSKRERVIAAYPGAGDVISVTNATVAITAWLDTLPASSVIAMEATGTYHRRLAALAHERGLVVYVINPRDVYYYARAMGARGKTDVTDARLRARYVAHEQAHLHRYVPPSPRSEQRTTLRERRALLVRTRQALKQSLAELPALDVEKHSALNALEALIKAIDRERAPLNGSDPPTTQWVTRLRTISGVGPLVATLLAALFQRFAFRHADALIAYLGLDPMNRANIMAVDGCPNAVIPSGGACWWQQPCPPRVPKHGVTMSPCNAPKPCPLPPFMSSSPANYCAPPSHCTKMQKNSSPRKCRPLDNDHRIFRGDDDMRIRVSHTCVT